LEENMGTTKDEGINLAGSGARQKKRQKKRRKHRGRVVRCILILFVLVYLPALWKWIFHGNIETDVLYSGNLEISIRSEGVLIWDETYVKSPKEGFVIPKAEQGERIPNNYNFAVIVDKDSQRILKEIENLEKNIIRQFAENNPEVLDLKGDFRDKVQSEVNKLTEIAINKNFSAIGRIEATLENLLYQRNRKLFEETGNRLYLEDKKRELEILQAKLNESALNVKSEFSGIVVWGVDSADGKYDVSNIQNLKPEDLIVNENTGPYISAGYDQPFEVNKGQTFARLVSNETGRYVCVIGKKDSNRLKKGDDISLRIDGIKDLIPCAVESIEHFDDKSKVVVSFNRYIEKIVQYRHIKADLVIESVEGLKIPQRSLVNRNIFNNTADVFVVRTNRAVRKRVRIIAEQDSFAIIESAPDSTDTNPVRIFDIYVVNPQNIEEGQVID